MVGTTGEARRTRKKRCTLRTIRRTWRMRMRSISTAQQPARTIIPSKLMRRMTLMPLIIIRICNVAQRIRPQLVQIACESRWKFTSDGCLGAEYIPGWRLSTGETMIASKFP